MKDRCTCYEDYEDVPAAIVRELEIKYGAEATASELDIKQGTEEMQYLLDYIYNRTGVIVGYWNDSLFRAGKHFVDFILSEIMCYIDDVFAKSNYPTMAFDGANTRSLKEYIARELFVNAYHENSKRF